MSQHDAKNADAAKAKKKRKATQKTRSVDLGSEKDEEKTKKPNEQKNKEEKQKKVPTNTQKIVVWKNLINEKIKKRNKRR